MRRLIARIAAAAILVLAVRPGAMAKDPMPDPQVPLTGDFVNTFTDGEVNEIEAGTAFFILNGWCGFAGERTALLDPRTGVQFTINGQRLVEGRIVDMHFYDWDPACRYAKYSYVNFRHGLPAGTYILTAQFTWTGVEVDSPRSTLIVH